MSSFLLSQVLSQLGKLESVMLATFGGSLTRGGTGGFEILLLYPGQGIFVNYTTPMQIIGENVQGCPSNTY